MALIAIAADKGAPGVTTACVALAAIWPRPVLLAECDPAGGDLVYRFPAAGGGRLDPERGLLSLAVAVRRGLVPGQVWEHVQKLPGGLDLLAGVVTAEQGAGLEPLWGPVGAALAGLPDADVIADCGRLGPDGPHYDLLAQASLVVLVTGDTLAQAVRLRERAEATGAALRRRGRAPWIGVAVVAPRRRFHAALAGIGNAVGSGTGVAGVVGGLAYEPRSAQRLNGEWGGSLGRSLLIRTARDLASRLSAYLAVAADAPQAPPARLAAVSAPPPPAVHAARAVPPPAAAAPAHGAPPPPPAARPSPPASPVPRG